MSTLELPSIWPTAPVYVTTSDWWRTALFLGRLECHEDEPQPGYYKKRLGARSKIWLPARIWLIERRDELGRLESDVEYHCEVDGIHCDCFIEWTHLAKHPISEAEYRHMSEERDGTVFYAD